MNARGFALLCVLLTALVGAAQPAKPRLDSDGDPLPPGALFRLGSARWRHDGPIGDVACTRDGKAVVSISLERLRLWDPATGKQIGSIPPKAADSWGRLALAPD